MKELSVEFFDELWKESQPKDGMKHTRETWDRLAENWKHDPPEVMAAKDKQCREIVNYLLSRGAIDENSSVIDIGCGSGNYSVEFAKKVKHVTCSDISPKMLEYAKEAAADAGLSNMDFVECDFMDKDADLKKWEKQFDLTFTSLTPAMDGLQSIEQCNAISRNWCFNNSFVYRKDNVRNAVIVDFYGKEVTNRWGNSSAYCLFNILWHMGYAPEVRYYKEVISYEYELTKGLAEGIASNVIRDRAPTDEEVTALYDYLGKNLAKDGMISKNTESLFAWTIWNVNHEV